MRIVSSLLLAAVCGAGLRCGETPEPAEAPDPAAITERLDRGEQFLSLGKPKDAAIVAAELQATHGQDWRVHDLVARIHLHEALRLREAGLMRQSEGELASAVAAYRSATTLAPTLAGLHQSAARTAHMAGEPTQSEAWFRRSIELDANDPRPPLCLAQLMFESDPQEARRLLDRAITLDPNIPEAHASLALLEAIEGREAAATDAMARAVSGSNQSAAIRVVQARMYRLLGDPARGVEVLLTLPTEAASEEAIATELAACWQALERPDRVADVWSACFTANAHRTDAWIFALRAADAHLLAGDRPSAASCIAQAEMCSAPPDRVEAVRSRAAAQVD